MLRRQLLGGAVLATRFRALAGQNPPVDTVIAGATEDTTPRVGIVLSSFRGGQDHDGTKIEGLREPAQPSAQLTLAQIEDMLQKALELGTTRHGGLSSIVEPDHWVVVKPQIITAANPGGRTSAGRVTDPRIVRSIIRWLAARGLGSRITIADSPSLLAAERFDPWESDWGGAFGGLSYRELIREFATTYPRVRFEIRDLDRDAVMEMQALRREPAPGPSYRVPETLLHCDRLISVAPLGTASGTGVWLTLGNYAGVLPGAWYGQGKEKAFETGKPEQVLVDLLSFRPADYSVLGGEWEVRGDGPYGPAAEPVHHNLVLAGSNAVAVDACGAASMGFQPAAIKHLALAQRRNLGTIDLDLIWTRGNTTEEANGTFQGSKEKAQSGPHPVGPNTGSGRSEARARPARLKTRQ